MSSYEGTLYLACGHIAKCTPAEAEAYAKKIENWNNPPKRYCPECGRGKKIRSAA